jgi:hypothetical protein
MTEGQLSAHSQEIQVTVQLIEGGSKLFTVSLEQPVGALKQRAMGELGVQPAPGAVYSLFFNNQRLDDSITLEAALIVNGAVLILATEPQVGQGIFA